MEFVEKLDFKIKGDSAGRCYIMQVMPDIRL